MYGRHLFYLMILLYLIISNWNKIIEFMNNIRMGFRNKTPVSKVTRIDQMNKKEFYLFIQKVFKNKGYSVDIILKYDNFFIIKQNGKKLVVFVIKLDSRVTVGMIEKSLKRLNKDEYFGAIVVTNNYFTPRAEKFAESNNTKLWNREKLMKEIVNVNLS